VFTARVVIDGQVRGIGTGTAKKHAEQEAAEAAFRSVTADAAPGDPSARDAAGSAEAAES